VATAPEVILPVEDRPEREFAALLRAADETFGTATVEADSPLHGMPVSALAMAVIAVRPDGEGTATVALPDDDEILSPGDTVFVIARPEALRRLEAAGEPLDPAPDDGSAEPPATDTGDGSPNEGQQSGGSPESSADDVAGEPGARSFDELESVLEPGETDRDDGGDQPAGSDDLAPDEADDAAGLDDEDDNDAGGDSKSFTELKEEFESGEADWDEEIDDSPDEDMRLDE